MEKLKYQQGDVLLHATTIPSGDYEKLDSPILQHGEHTGHKHMLHLLESNYASSAKELPHGFEVLRDKTSGERFLRVVTPMALRHEEHNPIEVTPGEYRIGIVMEYDHFKEEAREVVD